jgi:uncharacterized repeat protein (TIGR01451 family)
MDTQLTAIGHRGSCARFLLASLLSLCATTAFGAADLAVTEYSSSPDNTSIPKNALVTFTIRVRNFGPDTVTDGQARVTVSSLTEITTTPAGCTLSGSFPAQEMICNLPNPFNVSDSTVVTYTANAVSAGTANTLARATSPLVSDSNSSNDSETLQLTVLSSGDLTVAKTPSVASAPAGSDISYTLSPNNAGPDNHNSVRITDTLPSATDFTYQSATGTDWSCNHSSAVVTCDYTGLGFTGAAPVIVITGTIIKAIEGTITNVAAIESTNLAIVDTDTTNDSSGPIIVTVTSGADVAAGISLPATIVTLDSANLTLTLTNLGPMDLPANATISTTLPASLTINSVPAGCVQVTQTVTCTAGAISTSGNMPFVIGISGATPNGAEILGATAIATGITDPALGNNNASAGFEVVVPNADLSLTKAKSPDPVSNGAAITNTVTIRNNGPSVAGYTPGTPIVVVDTLGANETFTSSPTVDFSCSLVGSDVTCTTTGTGGIAVNGTLDVVILTQAGVSVDQDISNTVCANTSLHTPSDNNAGNNCDTATARATTEEADLSIVKEVSLSSGGPWSQSGMTVGSSDNSYFIRLQVTNNELLGGSVARNADVTDTIENYINATVSSPTGDILYKTGLSIQTSPVNGTCNLPASSGTLSCSLTDMNPQETRTIIFQVDRAFESGSISNTANVSSPDTTDSATANNNSTATFSVVGIADIVVESKVVSPSEPRAGQLATYVINVKNVGANPATSVTLSDDVDESLFASTGTLPVSPKVGSSCTLNSSTLALACSMGTFDRGDTFQVIIEVRPLYPFGGASTPGDFPATYTNTATTTTASVQAAGHQSDSTTLLHNVLGPLIDLRVTKEEPDASFDPIAFGDQLAYDIRISNGGNSRAHNIEVTETPTPPSGYTMTFDSLTVNPIAASTGFNLRSAPNASCTGAPLICRVDGTTLSENNLDENEQVILRLLFNVGGVEPSSALSFNNAISGSASEIAFDPLPSNNSASQSTSVLPRTDLEVLSKTRVGALLRNINEPVTYNMVFRNNGPTELSQVQVTDTLPSGFSVVGTPTAIADGGSSATVSGISCSGTSSVACTIDGAFSVAASDTVTLTLVARAQHPYAAALDSNRTNTASIAVGLDGSGDPLSHDNNTLNNSATEVTQIQAATLSGQVYTDNNRDDSIGGSEGINGVTITLSGTDLYGNSLSNVTATSSGNGDFTIDRLPPGASYTIVETQSADHFDRMETAGSGGGTVDNSSYGNSAAENSISDIGLTAAADLTGYIFQEYAEVSISGVIYADANNDGNFSGESGINIGAGNEIRLTGTDYDGNSVDQTANLNGSGVFSFNDLAPSDGSGYNLKQEVAATGFFDGLDQNGSGAVIANSSGRTLAAENIVVGVVDPGDNLTNRNFGEVGASTLSGMVFLDLDSDAVRDAGENSGFSGSVVQLTGTNDLSEAIDCSNTTTNTGTFAFPISGHPDPLCQSLRPGTYTLNQTPPSGLTHTGAYIGSAGGNAGSQSGANTAAPGASVVSITNIVLAPSTTASNYNFGERGDGLSGYVYVDGNNDGERGASESGIPGVTITLSGNLANNQSVCTVVTCAISTDAAGNFSYPGLSDSDGTGYTLTQQPQVNAPLANYTDGIDRAGDVAGSTLGSAGNDVISDILIVGNMLAQNYRFGERASSLTGSVYVDGNNDGTLQTGEPLLENVTLSLSGNTNNAENICTFLGGLSPARSCDTASDASGNYLFADLPAGIYSITQAIQPPLYADGLEGAGSPSGTVDNTPGANTISNIALLAGTDGSGYRFGERGAIVNGSVVKDLNRNGTLTDTGDTPLEDVTVTLLDSGGNEVTNSQTATDGLYEFTNVPAGNYSVVETQPAGYGSSTANTVAITVTPGSTTTTDFGDTISSLAGSVFIDADSDGVRDSGELGLANVSINLSGTDAASNVFNLDVQTDATGNYLFSDLLAGTYALSEAQPNGYADGLDSLGSASGTLGNDSITAISLPEATDATDYGFGENGQSLTGAIYVDENGNGTRDAGEAGIPSVSVTLAGSTANSNDVCGFVTCVQVSDASGNYQYPNLPGSAAAGYSLTQQPQTAAPLSNYADGQESAGNVGGATRGTAGNDVITGIVINANDSALGYTFGELAIGLSGAVYSDTNDSGVQDPGEPGIAGVIVTLSGTTATAQDVCSFLGTLVPSQSCGQQSASNGSFLFPDIPAGTYTLTETQPSGYLDGIENAGIPAGTVSNGSFGSGIATNQISNITLSAGQAGSAYTFGERGAVVSGIVFRDADRNGSQDVGTDTGLGGVVINLRASGGTLIGTTTAADGSYRLTDLAADNYQVEEVQPAGYGSSTPDTASISLTTNGAANVDFADTVSTMAGSVYIDIDDSGTQESTEPGLPGVEITLSGTDAAGAVVNRATTTAADGTYLFSNVLAGTYSLIETHPTNFTDGSDVAGNLGGDVSDDRIDNIVLGTSTDAIDYRFGEGGQVIAGTVYVDLNNNGTQDAGETGLDNVTIELRNLSGTVIETLLTDNDGHYRLADVAAGEYLLVQTQPAGYGSAQENPSNSVPVTVAVGVVNDTINFGEDIGSLAGAVFNDTNGNGLRDNNEPGVPGATLRLVGVDDRGNLVDLNTDSGSDGRYRFPGLVGGTYELTETQPSGFTDGPDYAGTAGGTVNNDRIVGITLPAALDAVNYHFTEGGNLGAIEGSVWRDDNHNRGRDANEETVGGWIVELRLGATVLQSTTTDTDGGYRFTEVAPGSGYELAFINPVSSAEFGGAQPNENGASFTDGQIDGNNPGGASIDAKTLTQLRLLPGETLTQQSLPLDPSGIVYDAITRLPVAGASVTINGPAGFDADLHLVGGTNNVTQTTGDDGVYQYLLLPGAPTGEYQLAVAVPIGAYNPVTPSNLIPVCPGTLRVGPTPNPLLVQSNSTPPPQGVVMDCNLGTSSTVYYLAFNIDVASSAEILQNHIPVDPILEDALLVAKRTAKTYAVRGDLVPYTISATNTLPGPLNDVQLVDRIPPGFKYRAGSARIDGIAAIPQIRGNELVWSNVNFDAGQQRNLSVLLVVSSGATEGKKTNYAFAFNPLADATISNIADATVRVIPDPNTDCTDIIGKVFDDKNANGYQDRGENGLAGVRVVTVRGLLITTDSNGRYHIACPYIANEEYGSNFIVKLDTRSLPTGYRLTTDNPHTMRIARGKFVKMNFGAANMPVVRIDVDANAFVDNNLGPDFDYAIWQLVDVLEAQPTVLRIAYTAHQERKRTIAKRIKQVREVLTEWWDKEDRQQRLIIEEEVIVVTGRTPAGDRHE